MILRKIGVIASALLLFTTAVMADTIEVKENHPTKYVVKKGDTLWDISAKFLKKPWYWPKIWNVNPQVDDPHWIYPGDVLTLVWVDGKPYVQKVTPTPKKTAPVPTISAEEVKSFLKHDLVLPADEDELERLPYVLGQNDGRSLMANTTDLYVKGSLTKGQQYGTYRKGEVLKNSEGKKVGYLAKFTGVVVGGETYDNNMNRAYLVKNAEAVGQGNFVLPLNEDIGYSLYFIPKAATVDAKIIALADSGAVVAGKYDTVLIDKGARDGVSTGDVFSITRPGLQIAGKNYASAEYSDMATAGKQLAAYRENKLPDDVIGQIMVYKTYDNVSLALVMITKAEVQRGYGAIKP